MMFLPYVKMLNKHLTNQGHECELVPVGVTAQTDKVKIQPQVLSLVKEGLGGRVWHAEEAIQLTLYAKSNTPHGLREMSEVLSAVWAYIRQADLPEVVAVADFTSNIPMVFGVNDFLPSSVLTFRLRYSEDAMRIYKEDIETSITEINVDMDGKEETITEETMTEEQTRTNQAESLERN